MSYQKAARLITAATTNPFRQVGPLTGEFRAICTVLPAEEFGELHDFMLRLQDDLAALAPELLSNHAKMFDAMAQAWMDRQMGVREMA